MSEKLLTVEGLAQALDVPKSWIYMKSRSGLIPTFRAGKYLRFQLDKVLEALKNDAAR